MTLAIATPTVKAEIEVVGPKEARYLLRMNTHNRHVSVDRVATMARDMVGGHWVLNGETIKVSREDRLLDGQHRLLAVVESGVQVPMMIVRGLDDDAQDSVDIGAKRQFADVLTLAGESNSHNLGAAVRFCWYIDTFGRPKQFGMNPSLAELRAWLDQNPRIREGIAIGQRAGHSVIRYTPSVANALWYLMSRIDEKQAAEFWENLIGGDVGAGDPIFALREALFRDLGKPHRMSVDHRAALTIKAWNHSLNGRIVQVISWKKEGKHPEAFPVLKGKEDK